MTSDVRGYLRVTTVDSAPHRISSPASVPTARGEPAENGPGRVRLLLQEHGVAEVAQEGRRTVLEAGDMTILVTSRPYRLTFADHGRTHLFGLPLRALTVPEAVLAGLAATAIRDGDGPEKVLSSFLHTFLRREGAGQDRWGELVSGIAADLVTTLVTDRTAVRAAERHHPTAVQGELLRRIRTHQLGLPERQPLQPCFPRRVRAVAQRVGHCATGRVIADRPTSEACTSALGRKVFFDRVVPRTGGGCAPARRVLEALLR